MESFEAQASKRRTAVASRMEPVGDIGIGSTRDEDIGSDWKEFGRYRGIELDTDDVILLVGSLASSSVPCLPARGCTTTLWTSTRCRTSCSQRMYT